MKGSLDEKSYEMQKEKKNFMNEKLLIKELIEPNLENGKVTIWSHGYPCEESDKQTKIVKKILKENNIEF